MRLPSSLCLLAAALAWKLPAIQADLPIPTITLSAAQAELAGGALRGALHDPAPAATPCPCVELGPGTGPAAVWRAVADPGVYNALLRYQSRDAAPAVSLDVDANRALAIALVKTKPDGELDTISLGPLAFGAAGEVRFRLRRTDADGAGVLAVAEVILEPIGGTLESALHPPAPPAPAGIATRTNPADGAALVRVPAGGFIMGGLPGQEANRVTLPGFWIYQCPVTVRQYRRFCEDTRRAMPPAPGWGWRDDHPVVNISWFGALAYAGWAGVRLPTEAEWEKAARGPDGRVLPWGNDFDPAKLQSPRDLHGFAGTTPVGYFPGNVSPYGCLDMAGNVWQWCGTRIAPYPYRADDGREDTATHFEGERRTYRGGGFVMNSWRGDWTILHRGNFYPRWKEGAGGQVVEVIRDHIGFRCAMSENAPPTGVGEPTLKITSKRPE